MRFKRGQVTIFIIIGIIIVVLGVLIYLIFPQIKTTLGLEETSPALFIQTCLEDKIKDTVETISLQGGSVEPEHFVIHDDEKVEYLCYTNEYFRTCVVQQPMLKTHIQNEIKKEIKDEVNDCFDSLENSYQKRGYQVSLKKGAINSELLPKRIVTTFNYSLTLTKTDTEKFDSFIVVLNNNLYELVAIASSILQWETTYGNANTNAYMTYYNDLKVEKDVKSDGTKVYMITDLNTRNKFQFASRSVVWAPGV